MIMMSMMSICRIFAGVESRDGADAFGAALCAAGARTHERPRRQAAEGGLGEKLREFHWIP